MYVSARMYVSGTQQCCHKTAMQMYCIWIYVCMYIYFVAAFVLASSCVAITTCVCVCVLRMVWRKNAAMNLLAMTVSLAVLLNEMQSDSTASCKLWQLHQYLCCYCQCCCWSWCWWITVKAVTAKQHKAVGGWRICHFANHNTSRLTTLTRKLQQTIEMAFRKTDKELLVGMYGYTHEKSVY